MSTALIDAGLTDRMRIFDTPVPTAPETARTLGCETAAIVNSLVFDADGSPLLILASGAHRVDTERVAGELGFDTSSRVTLCANQNDLRRSLWFAGSARTWRRVR